MQARAIKQGIPHGLLEQAMNQGAPGHPRVVSASPCIRCRLADAMTGMGQRGDRRHLPGRLEDPGSPALTILLGRRSSLWAKIWQGAWIRRNDRRIGQRGSINEIRLQWSPGPISASTIFCPTPDDE